MTPKEKADELVDKMRDAIYDTAIPDGWNRHEIFEASKQCALIAVEEILKLDLQEPYKNNNYWLEVKQELLNLKNK